QRRSPSAGHGAGLGPRGQEARDPLRRLYRRALRERARQRALGRGYGPARLAGAGGRPQHARRRGVPRRGAPMKPRIFLLSPASSSGERARLLFNPHAQFALALAVRTMEGAPLGEVFSFLSGLYFRGKLGYARAFARPPAGVPGVVVITPSEGLVSPESPVTLHRLRRRAPVPSDARAHRNASRLPPAPAPVARPPGRAARA